MIDETIGINGAARAMEISRTALYERIRNGVFPRRVPSDLKRVYWFSHEVAAVVRATRSGSSYDELRKVVQIIHECREKRLEDAIKAAAPSAICSKDIVPVNGYVPVQGVSDKDLKRFGLEGDNYAYGRVVKDFRASLAHDGSSAVFEENVFVVFKKEHGIRFVSTLKDYLLVRECDFIAVLAI